jgi:putative addiction module component (TIGR02574 family)
MLLPTRSNKMSSKIPFPPPGFDALSLEDQIEYVQELWDRITSHPEQVSVPDWHLEIIKERLALENPEEGTPWEEFEKELLEQLMKG